MIMTGKHLSRRTALKGLGATIALPLLDSMMPANRLFAQSAAGKAAFSGEMYRMVMRRRTQGVSGVSTTPASTQP